MPKLNACLTWFQSPHADEDDRRPDMSSRKDDLLAKKARLAELKRQRELRQEQLTTARPSLAGVSLLHYSAQNDGLMNFRLRRLVRLQKIESRR